MITIELKVSEPELSFELEVEENDLSFDIEVSVTDLSFGLEIGSKFEVVTAEEYYEEEYSVIPQTNSQELETKNKLMRNDLVVEAIPYYEVSNDCDGLTVIIG